MTKIDYVQLEPKAFLADLIAMTTVESGAYARLILYLYNNGGSCPNSIESLKQITGNPRNFNAIWKKIEHKFQVSAHEVTHKRVRKELTEAKRRIELKTERAKKASAARWAKNGDCHEPEQCTSSAQAMQEHPPSNANGNGKGKGNGNGNTTPIPASQKNLNNNTNTNRPGGETVGVEEKNSEKVLELDLLIAAKRKDLSNELHRLFSISPNTSSTSVSPDRQARRYSTRSSGGHGRRPRRRCGIKKDCW